MRKVLKPTETYKCQECGKLVAFPADEKKRVCPKDSKGCGGKQFSLHRWV